MTREKFDVGAAWFGGEKPDAEQQTNRTDAVPEAKEKEEPLDNAAAEETSNENVGVVIVESAEIIEIPAETVVVIEDQEKPVSDKKEERERDKKGKKTYILSERIVKAVNLMSAFEGVDKSEIVRTAIERYVTEKYFEEADKYFDAIEQ